MSERLHNTVLSNKLCGGLGLVLRHWLIGGGRGGDARDTNPPGGFFYFYAVFGKIWPKNRLPLVSEILVVVFLSSVDAKN